MQLFNSNAFHNALNVIGAIAGALLLTDWTAFGLDASQAAQVAAGILLIQNVVKVVVNTTRDGVTGLLSPQPPVQK